MKSPKLALLYGFVVWAIPFVAAILIFPLRTSERPLFESIMPVVLAFITVLSASLYFKRVESSELWEGFLLGVIWTAISIVLDLLMFMQGPMQMTFVDYIKDIGLTYLVIPTITLGSGYLLEKRR